jgi:hypothetical protein
MRSHGGEPKVLVFSLSTGKVIKEGFLQPPI